MRRIGRHRRKKEKIKQKAIIICVFVFLLIMTSGYAAFSTNITFHAKGNIKEPSRVIKSWVKNETGDFHTDFYRNRIVTVTFLDNNKIPSNAIESWNVSEDQKHGSVKAWIVQNDEDNTKYDLYIGAKDGVIANPNSTRLFSDFREVTSINFNNNFDTSNVTDMSYMFAWCTNIETIDISSFNTSNVIYMQNMFSMYDNNNFTVIENKLSNIILGDNFDTQNVTNIVQMFAGCENLTQINVENWNTSNINNISSVFAYCSSLINLDLSKWDTSKVTNMDWLFDECNNLEEVNLSNFNTENVTSMYQMFQGCHNLEKVNLCSFNTQNVSNSISMFYDTPKLKAVYVGSGWTLESTEENGMFAYSNISDVTKGQCETN